MRRSKARLSLILALWLAAGAVLAADWPQFRGPNRDGVWRESGIVERFATKQISPKWRVRWAPAIADRPLPQAGST